MPKKNKQGWTTVINKEGQKVEVPLNRAARRSFTAQLGKYAPPVIQPVVKGQK
jgi:hypothetical protein